MRKIRTTKKTPSVKAWHGVRLRVAEAAADPDSPVRSVVIPADWNDAAANALAAMFPAGEPISLPEAADAWISPASERARRAGQSETLAHDLHILLITRRGTAGTALWTGDAAGTAPRFVLNLPAFFDAETGFDLAGLRAAIRTATLALTFAVPEAMRIAIGFADLDGLLAAFGIDYDSDEARATGATLAALLRGETDALSAELAEHFGARGTMLPDWPALPPGCPIPELTDAAQAALALAGAATSLRHTGTTAICIPDATDAMLGVETGGIAPAFSPVTLHSDPDLTQAASLRLIAEGLSDRKALARTLAGDTLFPPAATRAYQAMHDAVGGFIHAMPARPVAAPPPAPRRDESRFEALPDRHAGYTQKTMVGRQPLFLRTGQYEDGRLGEVSITQPKDNAAARGLMEAFSAALSIGLQHGVPLSAYVDALLQTRFGASGLTEGDPDVPAATSPVDYVMRHLAAHYLGRRDLPPAEVEQPDTAQTATPLLPLDLPSTAGPRARKRGHLKVVA